MGIVTQVAGSTKGTPTGPASSNKDISAVAGQTTRGTPTGSTPTGSTSLSSVASDVPWHHIVLWFLGAVALIALADPAPQVATGIVVLLILGTLLNNWDVYRTYLGLPGNAGSAASAVKG